MWKSFTFTWKVILLQRHKCNVKKPWGGNCLVKSIGILMFECARQTNNNDSWNKSKGKCNEYLELMCFHVLKYNQLSKLVRTKKYRFQGGLKINILGFSMNIISVAGRKIIDGDIILCNLSNYRCTKERLGAADKRTKDINDFNKQTNRHTNEQKI